MKEETQLITKLKTLVVGNVVGLGCTITKELGLEKYIEAQRKINAANIKQGVGAGDLKGFSDVPILIDRLIKLLGIKGNIEKENDEIWLTVTHCAFYERAKLVGFQDTPLCDGLCVQSIGMRTALLEPKTTSTLRKSMWRDSADACKIIVKV